MFPLGVIALASGALLTGASLSVRNAHPPLVQRLRAEPPSKRLFQRWYERGQSFTRQQRALLLGDQRSQQMQEMRTTYQEDQVASEQEINQNLLVASAGTAVAATGLLTHTALGPLSIPFTLYTCIPLVKVVYQGLAEERRLRGPVIDLVAVGASLSAHYYLLTAASCTLMCVAEKVVYRTQDRSRRGMITVFQQQEQQVWVLRNGVEVATPLVDVQVGDIVVVDAGGVIPVDGVITSGAATIDQHMLTGEAQPVEKGVGDRVLAATLVLSGRTQICVEKTGNATITAQIGAVMDEIADYRERQELRCDETADRLVVPTLAAGAITLARLGGMSAVTVIGANFTETLRVAYPLGALSYLNLAAQQGILVKDGRALEALSQVDTVIFDKTGTLTLDQPHVAAIHPCADLSATELLTYAAAAEFRQSHPIARAILEAAQQQQLVLPMIAEAAYAVGFGIKVRVMDEEGKTGRQRDGGTRSRGENSQLATRNSQLIRVGSARYMAQEGIVLPEAIADLQRRCHAQGHSLVYVALDDQLAGALELHATLRPEVQTVVQQLRQRGLHLYIISGDQRQPTQYLAETLGVDGYFAEVLPADKAQYVEQLQKQGHKVCFIGDGINDAIALKQADVSVSLRGATTVATDIAQVIFMDQSLARLDHLFTLAHRLDANLKRSFATMIVPSCINLVGALFFRFGIRSAILLFNTSLLAGVANSLAPLWTGEQLEANSQQSPQQEFVASRPVSAPRAHRAIPTFPQSKRLELSDRGEIEAFVQRFPPYSQFGFTSLFAYDIADDTEICWLHGNLVVRLLEFNTGRHFYSFLGDRNVTATIQQLLARAQQEKIIPELLIVPEVCLRPSWVELHQRFVIQEDRDCFDYILAVDNLRQLAMESQSGQARDLQKFLRKHPTAQVQEIDFSHPEIQRQVWTLFQHWADKRQKTAEDLHVEQTAIARIMGIAAQLPLVTLGVYLDERLVAYTVNEVVQDGYYVGHFGKSDPAYRGLGIFLEQETAQQMAQRGCHAMNYEEDLGIPGLRAYKESLQPIGYLKKYTIGFRE